MRMPCKRKIVKTGYIMIAKISPSFKFFGRRKSAIKNVGELCLWLKLKHVDNMDSIINHSFIQQLFIEWVPTMC